MIFCSTGVAFGDALPLGSLRVACGYFAASAGVAGASFPALRASASRRAASRRARSGDSSCRAGLGASPLGAVDCACANPVAARQAESAAESRGRWLGWDMDGVLLIARLRWPEAIRTGPVR